MDSRTWNWHKWVCVGKQTHCVQDVAEDLPVVEKGVEEEVPAEPEDGASAEQACDEHTPADQIVEGLSQEEGQTFQEFAKDTWRLAWEFRVESRVWKVYVTTMSQHYHRIVHESMCNFDWLSRVVQHSLNDNRPTRPFVVSWKGCWFVWGNWRNRDEWLKIHQMGVVITKINHMETLTCEMYRNVVCVCTAI